MDINQLHNIIRIGCVSSVDPQQCTARVTFNDKDGMVSNDLPIIVPCSKSNKAYWLPDIDTQVLCIFLPNPSGNGINDGYIVGAFYSDVDTPAENGPKIKSLKFDDGSYVRYDGAGNIQIHAAGSITITADGSITINGATVNIN